MESRVGPRETWVRIITQNYSLPPFSFCLIQPTCIRQSSVKDKTWEVTEALHLEGHSLGITLCCRHLEILNNFIFELRFCRLSPRDNGACEWAEICESCISSVPCRQYSWFAIPCGHRVLVEFREAQSEYQVSVVCLYWVTEEGWQRWEDTCDVPTRTCFVRCRRHWPSKKGEQPQHPILSYPFLLSISQPVTLQMTT